MQSKRSKREAEKPIDEAVVNRVRAEYREMPGLKLTTEQASRLWRLDRRECEALLRRLADERVLRRTRDGSFVLLD